MVDPLNDRALPLNAQRATPAVTAPAAPHRELPGIGQHRRPTMRTPRLLAWLAGLTLSAVLLAPAAAFAAETQTIHFRATDSRAEYNPCSGAPGMLTIMLSGVMHITDLGDGTVHRTTTTTGTVSFVPEDPSQASFSGHLAESRSEITNPRNAVVTNAENVVVHGSDGSLGKQHILVHHTVNANGTVTSSIEIMEFTCQAR
jgi:hypothetical protein